LISLKAVLKGLFLKGGYNDNDDESVDWSISENDLIGYGAKNE
jgi:hypothetical protein